MRYQNLPSFHKHLTSASSQHLCRCYLLVVPDDYERAKAMKALCAHAPFSQPMPFKGSENSCREIADALLSPSLFGGDPVVVVDEVEKMGKKELQTLSALAENPQLCGYLFCAAKSKTPLTPSFERAGVVLDLAEEKPWDRERRLSEQLSERAQQGGKRLEKDALSLLLERLGPDAALLDAELDKLICYVGDRSAIGRADAALLCPCSKTQTLWLAAEEVVWEKGHPAIDANSFHGLVFALRSQCSLGLKILSLIESGHPRHEWDRYLSKIWPKTLEKRTVQAQKLGATYFQKGLDVLFDIELLSRTGQTNETALLDLFQSKLKSLQCPVN